MHQINHLYWRAGFGLSPEEWKEKKGWTVDKAVKQLFRAAKDVKKISAESFIPENPRGLTDEEKKAIRERNRKALLQQTIGWVDRMANPAESALLEKMSLFWHGHFACRSRSGDIATKQLNAIRENALGYFRDLVLAIAKDPAMIRYLNNQQNRKRQPNENFARELLELFTIGRGNYSEKDIKEAARAFTGWSSTIQGDFIFRQHFHDFGTKAFLGKSGNFNGEDILDIVLEKRETAVFITRKIYRYFVNIQPDESIIRELADGFYRADYHIGTLMETIFTSDWFYQPANMGTKIKSPVELIAGLKRSLHINFQNPLVVYGVLRALGQIPFNPPNVAGWPGGKAWIDNSTLMMRLNLPAGLLKQARVDIKSKDSLKALSRSKRISKLEAQIDFSPIEELTNGKSDDVVFDDLREWLLLSQPQFSQQNFDNVVHRLQVPSYSRAITLLFMSLPEYQMC